MKPINFISGTLLLLISILTIRCQKEDNNPYTIYDGEPGRPGYCSVVSEEGDLYIVGTRNQELLVLKTNLEGDLIWENTYTLFGSEGSTNGWTIEETFDHGFIISVFDSWDIYETGLLKINASGDSIWSYILHDTGHIALKAVTETANHAIIVIEEEMIDVYQDLHQVTILKISKDGEFIDSKVHPELFTNEVFVNAWQADQDGNIIISTFQYNQPGSIWTVSPGLAIISQEPVSLGKEIAYFSETQGTYICSEEVYDHSTFLFLSKEVPGNDPVWEQEILMPCEGWVYHDWIGPVAGGYMVLGTLWDMGHSTYYPRNSYCMEIDASGNQNWLWYDKKEIYGAPYNFHYKSEDRYLIVGCQRGDNYHIVLWQLQQGNAL
jgi:hypothetical protein